MTDRTKRRLKSVGSFYLFCLVILAIVGSFIGACFLLSAIAPDWSVAIFVIGTFIILLSIGVYFDEY